ncbi:MAG TPA: RNA-guided endonuclease TnpB family protein [Corynebacterium sp.]|nr:RNA-guided endonuclease TnpB family protein [Corynebacterium sp.]
MATQTTHRAYKFRFYPTPAQEDNLNRTWGCVRVVYNKALELRTTTWYEKKERVSHADTDRALTQWKETEELAFLREVSAVALQQSLRHLQAAFQNFWAKRAGYPRFKSKKKSTLGLRYTLAGLRLRGGQVFLAKQDEPLTIVWSRPVDLDAVTSATVTRDRAGRWFISLLAGEVVESKPITGKTVGIDLGVKDAVITSTGARYNPSDTFDVAKKQALVIRRQKALSRKAKGSKNRAKARTKLARAHVQFADAKRDWLHKTTTRLVEDFDVICIEDLNVCGMTASTTGTGRAAKAGLNRGILSHNFAEFRELVEYKVNWYGKEVVVIDRYYPSSKRCSSCGHINQSLKLSHRYWTCTCGSHHDRDVNAAKNIKAAGLAVLASGV